MHVLKKFVTCLLHNTLKTNMVMLEFGFTITDFKTVYRLGTAYFRIISIMTEIQPFLN